MSLSHCYVSILASYSLQHCFMSSHSDEIWGVNGPFKALNRLCVTHSILYLSRFRPGCSKRLIVFQPFKGGVAGVTESLSHCLTQLCLSLKSPDILLKDFLVKKRIHSFQLKVKHHHSTTTWFDCLYNNFLFLKCLVVWVVEHILKQGSLVSLDESKTHPS